MSDTATPGAGSFQPPALRDVHESARLIPYLRETWQRRGYVWYVSMQELRSRQITNVLGNLWHLLNPLLTIGVYYLIFGLLIETDRGVDNFFAFLTIGLFIFQFTQKATIDGAKSIVSNTGLLKGIKFPRVILPVSSTLTEFIASLSTFGLMFVIVLLSGESPRLTWLLFPVMLGVQLLFNLGAAMVAARLTTHFRDTTQVLPFVFRLLLYGSGVIYNVDAYVTDHPQVDALFTLNPMYCFLTIGRWTISGGDLDPVIVLTCLGWTAVMLVGGFAWFRAAEDRYARN